MPKYGKAGVTLMAAIVAFVVVIPTAGAAATNIYPPAHAFTMDSTHVEFTVGSSVVVCDTGSTSGTVPTALSSEVTLAKMAFGNVGGAPCDTTGMEGAKFNVTGGVYKLRANSTTSANLGPSGESILKFEITSAPGCEWRTIFFGPTGVWTNGKAASPVGTPSTLKISNSEFYFEVGGLGYCPPALVKSLEAASLGFGLYEGRLSGTFVIRDYTSAGKVIYFQ